jgi:hypothetical protein
MKGTRVQSIIRELRGEKIDIVEFSDDPIVFVTNALSPARVQRVSIVDDRERVMEVIVEDQQLSLAIGKKGQNVRLAAKLTGWRIDIKSEEEKRREVEAQLEGLEAGVEVVEGETDLEGRSEDTASTEPLEVGESSAPVESPEAGGTPESVEAPQPSEAAGASAAIESTDVPDPADAVEAAPEEPRE